MKPRCCLLVALSFSLMAVWASSSVRAHHSFAAEYDAKQPITLKGIVNRLEWINPHAFMYLDVKQEDGKVTTWAFELAPPAMLFRFGWRKEMLKAGDTISVNGFRAKDGTRNLANARELTFSDGHTLLAGPGAGEPRR